MRSKIPDYLKIHTDGPHSQLSADPGDFWNAFSAATGWESEKRSEAPARRLKPVRRRTAASGESAAPAVPHRAAQELADAASSVHDQLQQTQDALLAREAELAVREGSVPAPTAGRNVARRLESVLRRACIATGCRAAGLYMLNEETSHLKLRVAYGLKADRLSQPPRPLRGATADLEAFVTGSCTVDDLVAQPDWNSPEPFAAGICVGVQGAEMPIGTLWMWRDTRGRLARPLRTTARLAAQMLALQLDRELSARRLSRLESLTAGITAAAADQQRLSSDAQRLAPGWETAGAVQAARVLSGSGCMTDINRHGHIQTAVYALSGAHIQSAVSAAALRASFETHAHYACQIEQVVARTNDFLWGAYAGAQTCDLLAATIDPDSGEAKIASGGACAAMIVNRYGCRPVVGHSHPLGYQPDIQIASTHTRLLPGDSLVVCGPGVVHPETQPTQGQISQSLLLDAARDGAAHSAAEMLAAVRRRAAAAGKCKNDWTVAVIRRA